MEVRARSLVIIGLLLAGDCLADANFTLRQHGVSAPLHTLAADMRAQGGDETQTGLRHIALNLQGSPRKFARALAPRNPHPLTPAMPPLPQVATGGARIVADGMQAGAPAASHVVGALGDTQFVQLASGRMAIYRKHDGTMALGGLMANTMFLDGGPDVGMQACAQQAGAAAVRYDQLAHRWIVSHQAQPHYLCLAISVGSDAAGRYYRYAMRVPAPFDDPTMALWPDAYYFTFNLFDRTGNRYFGARICGVDRPAMLRGAHAPTRCRDIGDSHGPLAPANLEGHASAPQAQAPALFLALERDGHGRGERLLMWRYSMSRNALSGPVAIPVAVFTIACANAVDGACIPQPHPGRTLGALGDRLMPGIAYRNDDGRESLVLNHAVAQADGQVGVRWYEIRYPFGAVQVYQQGTHAPDRANRWMASIGMDKAGNIALGYNTAAADTPAGIRYTGRQRHDAPGRMQGEEIIVNGTGVQLDSAGLWLPNGALSLDPADGCTFWYTQQYVPTTGRATWRTRIASFKFQSCI